MKILLSKIVPLTLLLSSAIQYADILIPLREQLDSVAKISYDPVALYMDSKSFTGPDITFTFPEGLFTQMPYVVATVKVDTGVVEVITFIPIIVSCSNSSVVVRVVNGFFLGGSEIFGEGAIVVTIMACGR